MRVPFSALFLASLLSLSAVHSQAQGHKPKQLKHVVTVTFKPGAPVSIINEVDHSFKNLGNLKMVQGYEWGISPIDEHNKENKHVYVSTFASEKELARYGASPEHQKHIKLGESAIKSVQTVDYWVEK